MIIFCDILKKHIELGAYPVAIEAIIDMERILNKEKNKQKMEKTYKIEKLQSPMADNTNYHDKINEIIDIVNSKP